MPKDLGKKYIHWHKYYTSKNFGEVRYGYQVNIPGVKPSKFFGTVKYKTITLALLAAKKYRTRTMRERGLI